MSAMFAGARSGPASTNLVEFKAGRCRMEAGSGPTMRKVIAEKDRGLIYIKQSSDHLMHFCWKNRETGAIVDDLIIFPGDTAFLEVRGCPDGQVFMLKFNSSEDRRLFWTQEPSVDPNIVQKVNDALNKPPPQRPTSTRERNTTGGGLASISNSEDIGTLGGLDQSQLMQLLQFMSPGGASGGESPSSLSNLLSLSTNRDGSRAQSADPSTPAASAPPPVVGAQAPPRGNRPTPMPSSSESEAPTDPANTSSSSDDSNAEIVVKSPEPKRGKPDDEMELD